MAKGPNMFSDLPSLDPSVRETERLNDVIDDTTIGEDIVILDEKLKERTEAQEAEALAEASIVEGAVDEAPTAMLAAEARAAAPVLEHQSVRDAMRLLFITTDDSTAVLGSLAQKHMLEIGQLFAEIHVVILNERNKKEETVPAVRLSENIWLYNTNSSSWWKAGFDAYRIVNEQLTFGGGFRPDMIVACDPFECGVVGHYLAKKYQRPFQVHILEDFYDPSFSDQDEHNHWRLSMAKFVLKRVDCIRTDSGFLRDRILEDHPEMADFVEVLPTYYNLNAWRDLVPEFDLKERYPQFNFIMLHISSMQSKSHTMEVIQGASPVLRQYPTVGLVIVGSGPLRAALEKQVIALGIQNQVEFEPTPAEVVSHMKSANILLHLSESPEEDHVVLQAASVKIPLIANISNIAGELFHDGESAFLCNTNDVQCVSKSINKYLNENQSRAKFALNAQEIVFERIEQDYTAYLELYRGSIERCIRG